MNVRVRTWHEPGQCSEPSYGRDCNGIATWTIDPYVQDIYGVNDYTWLCHGEYTGHIMDI